MASHKSAEKAIRKTAHRTEINKNRMGRIRTFVKKAEELLASALKGSTEKTAAASALVEAESEMMRGVSRGLIHKNTATRKISRLAKRLNAVS